MAAEFLAMRPLAATVLFIILIAAGGLSSSAAMEPSLRRNDFDGDLAEPTRLFDEDSPGLCDAINASPFFSAFFFCCDNQLFKTPKNQGTNKYFFRCCSGAGLFTDRSSRSCCGKELYDPSNEFCLNEVAVPLASYLNDFMFNPEREFLYSAKVEDAISEFGWPSFVKRPNDYEAVDHPAETERRNEAGVWHWDSTIWLNCSGRLVFNPEGQQATLLDCCGQTPYKRDRFYCVNDELFEQDYNNGQWIPPVAPTEMRSPFEVDFAIPDSERSAMLSCSGVWYSISYTSLFQLAGSFLPEFNQRFSCCGQEVYDIHEYVCTDKTTLKKRSLDDLPYGINPISHTLIMCGDYNAIGWRPDLGLTPAITYLVDEALPIDRRPDACCGIMLYSRATHGCTVNGLYPLTRIARSIVQPGLSPYWQCCDSTPYNMLDASCCGNSIITRNSASLCCDGVLYSSAAIQGEKFECCGRNRIDSRFYYCFENQVRLGPKRSRR